MASASIVASNITRLGATVTPAAVARETDRADPCDLIAALAAATILDREDDAPLARRVGKATAPPKPLDVERDNAAPAARMAIADVAATLDRDRAVAEADTRVDAVAVALDREAAVPVAVRAGVIPTYADAVDRDEAVPVAAIFAAALALAALVDFAVAVAPTRTDALAETDERDEATPEAVRAGTTPTKADAVDRDKAAPVAEIFTDALALALLVDCAVAVAPIPADALAEADDRDDAAPEAVAPVAGFDAPVCDVC